MRDKGPEHKSIETKKYNQNWYYKNWYFLFICIGFSVNSLLLVFVISLLFFYVISIFFLCYFYVISLIFLIVQQIFNRFSIRLQRSKGEIWKEKYERNNFWELIQIRIALDSELLFLLVFQDYFHFLFIYLHFSYYLTYYLIYLHDKHGTAEIWS
jgi:hypothetical protein